MTNTTKFRNAGKRQTIADIFRAFAERVLDGEKISKDQVFSKLEYNCYANHICEKATKIIMEDLKVFGN